MNNQNERPRYPPNIRPPGYYRQQINNREGVLPFGERDIPQTESNNAPQPGGKRKLYSSKKNIRRRKSRKSRKYKKSITRR